MTFGIGYRYLGAWVSFHIHLISQVTPLYATTTTTSTGCVVPVIHVQKSDQTLGMLAADTSLGSQECNPCTAEAESLQISLMPGFI